MPAPLYLSGPCEVCGQKAFGRNFGVLSCRACAAFFRRAAASAKRERRREDCEIGGCAIFADGKFQCRKCRLKRCYDVGMDSSKFQQDRDPISTSSNFTRKSPKQTPSPPTLPGFPSSLPTFLGRPSFLLCCEPTRASHIKTFIDVHYLLAKAESTLLKRSQKPYVAANSLERLALSLADMRLKPANKKMMQVTRFGRRESLQMWEQAFLETVEWFANFAEFTALKMSVQLKIVQVAWHVWTRLERLAETADFRRKHVFGDDVFMCAIDACMNIKDYQIDLSWCTNYSLEQLTFYMMPDIEVNWRACTQELTDLNPTDMELNFMLLQLCLHHAGKKYQGEVLEATDRLIQIQADNLHDYYVNTMNTPNYSARLTRLMRINRGIERDVWERREKTQLARVFNVLAVEFSHPDMFEGT